MSTASVTIRSVLGDERDAAVNPGAGYPWYSCPFCTYPVYVGEASPEHSSEATPAVQSRCGNPWCIANPAMPKDAAENLVRAALEAARHEASRHQDHEAALRRIDEYAANQRAAWEHIRVEATRQGACVGCALKSHRKGRVKYVHHRGQCPLAVRQN
jgi:hypothetical protein